MIYAAVIIVAVLGVWYVLERRKRRTAAMPAGRSESVVPHDAAVELYHNPFSLCSKKVRVCLAELGTDYVAREVDLLETGGYGNLKPSFLRINPGATVPVLVHDGHPVYESHQQIVYAAQHLAADGAPTLLPEHDPERQEVLGWVRWSALLGDDPADGLDQSLGNSVAVLTLPLFAAMARNIPFSSIFEGLLFHRIPSRAFLFLVLRIVGIRAPTRIKPMREIIENAMRASEEHFDHLEESLSGSGHEWLVGGEFTLADIGVMAIMDRLDELGRLQCLLQGRPATADYWDQLRRRPSFEAAIGAFRHDSVRDGRERLFREFSWPEQNTRVQPAG